MSKPVVVEAEKPAPTETPKSADIKKAADEARSSTIDDMFGVSPARRVAADEETSKAIDEVLDAEREEKEKPEKEKPEEEEKPEKEEPKKEEKEEEVEDLDVLDIDFDREPDAEEIDPDDIEIDDKDLDDKARRSIATMRNQLQIAGRRAKDAEAKLKEMELEIASKETTIKKLQDEVNSPKNVAADPFKHPEIKGIQDKIVQDRDTFTSLMPSEQREAFTKQFEFMLRDFADIQNSKNPEARDAMLAKLNERVDGLVDPNMVDRAMELISRNHGNYTDILNKIENFGDMAEQQGMEERVTGWTAKSTKAAAAIDSIAKMDSEIIDANPNTPSAYVAKLVRDEPGYAKRSEQAKAAVIESFYGKRPLTHEEVESIKSSEDVDGIKLEDFMKDRSKKEEAGRIAAMKRQYLILMLGPKIPKLLEQFATASQKEAAKEAERDALLAVNTPPKKTPEKKKEEPMRAQDRPSAVGSILEAM